MSYDVVICFQTYIFVILNTAKEGARFLPVWL